MDPDARGLIGTVSPKQTADPPAVETDPRADVPARIAGDISALEAELTEIDMLVAQARTEAERHELKRSQAAGKLAALPPGAPTDDVVGLNVQLVGLTRRASVMEAQVDSLEGKRRALVRFRDALAEIGDLVAGIDPTIAAAAGAESVEPAEATPAMSRVILNAQEDLRREIARAMHDGPAQSLTNIVLQAQIVERIVSKDPAQARNELRQLVAMVQQTLDATKSFIFDVRPMVLDDLGLVPTMRRATRERGRRAGIVVEFESTGADRRLAMDLESGLFRILDEAMAAYLSARAERVSVRLDWAEQLEARVSASRATAELRADQTPEVADKDLPPALAAMMEDRRADARDALEAARREAIVVLPPSTWREIQSRAGTLGMLAELSADGAELRLVADLPPATPPVPTGKS